MATTPADKAAADEAKRQAEAQAELAKRAEAVGLTPADGPQKIAEAEKAARIAGNFKEYVPEKHMEYARAVLRDQRSHDDRAAVEARDKKMLEEQGIEVPHEQAVNIAAAAQAKAESEEGFEAISKEELLSKTPEELEAMRDEEKEAREKAVQKDAPKDDKKK